ncbi:MAG: hypothetical protein ACREO5_06995, partial [Candidatus Binatia bacterium]
MAPATHWGRASYPKARAGNVLADLYSGGAVTNFEILYKGKPLDSLKSALILPEVLDGVQVVRRQASLQRRGTAACIYLHRQSDFNEHLFQHQFGQSERLQIVLGSGRGKMERQIRIAGAVEHGPGRASLQFYYYHPELGAEYIKKLFGDMQPVLG